MIIEKIVIKSFGLLTDMTLEFSDSVNVIEGRNESGKSTIAAFIRYMLYGFDNNEADDAPSERRKRISWSTGVASGSMYVRVKGKRYLITRTTTPSENFGQRQAYKEESSIVDLETGSPAFGKVCAGEVFFGVEKELFDNTAFIGQIADSGINEGTVKESIENILFSGNERINTQRAYNRVNDKMEALFHKSAAGGVIFDLARKCEDYVQRIERSNEDNKQILAKEAELYEIREAREKAILDREHFREIDSCYNNLMVIQTFDRLHELEEESERASETYSRFVQDNTRDGFVPDEGYLTSLAVSRELVNADYQRLNEANDAYLAQKNAFGITRETEGLIEQCDERGGEAKILADAKGFFVGAIKWLALGIFGALLAVAAAVLLVLGLQGTLSEWKTVSAVACGIFTVGVGACALLAIRSRKALAEISAAFGMKTYADLKGKIAHIGEARATRDRMISSIEAAEYSLNSAKDSYSLSKARLTELINKWFDEEPEGELGEFLDGLEGKVREFIDEKNRLLSDKTNLDLTVKEIRRTLAEKSEIDIRAQVSPLKRKALSGINHDEIINGIADNKAKIQEYDAAAESIENELAILKSKAGDLGEYHAKLQCLEERTSELQTRHKALYIASDAIAGAMQSLREEISPRLGDYSTKMMEAMTGGKYSSFNVSDGLKVSFTATDGEDKSVDFLSGGTRDLTYVAVRCALIDMLYREKPPVCFDESFAHQDNVRARAMMQAIKKLADENCQSFIFTCRNRESALAKEIIPGAGIFKLSLVDADND